MEKKNQFWKGALCGALAMFLVCGCLLDGGSLTAKLFGSGEAVDAKTERKLNALKNAVQEKYLYSDDIRESDMEDSLYKGYINALNDPYSVYYNEKETKELLESTSGEYYGIGVVVSEDMTTGATTIAEVYEDSPAQKAGLQTGDVLYKVDGKDMTSKDMNKIVARIKGDEGTKVEITVLRGESQEEVTVNVTRAKVEAKTIEYRMQEEQIGYIRVSEFDEVTYEQFRLALADLESQGMKGLVVDLRSNPGGNLETVCKMLDLMLPEGDIVYTIDKKGNKDVPMKSDEEHQFTKPLAVLVNEYSASASEIFAGAIQDYEVGQIVGTTTYGKGIVQQLFQMTDGTSLKLTISEYFTPKGRTIHKKGVTPDVEVESVKPDSDSGLDYQLEQANAVVKDELK